MSSAPMASTVKRTGVLAVWSASRGASSRTGTEATSPGATSRSPCSASRRSPSMPEAPTRQRSGSSCMFTIFRV